MVDTTTIRRVEIRASTAGVDESRQKLGTLDQAMQKLQQTLEQSNRLNEQAMQSQRELAASQTQAVQSMTAANDNLARSNSVVSTALRAGAKTAAEYGVSWAASAAKTALITAALTGLAAILGPVYIAYRVLKEIVDLVTDAINLSAEALERYRNIAADAAKADVSTDFFQRISKAATEAKMPVEDMTAALQKLEQTSRDKLGGSALQNRIDAHLKAGNFEGNSGVDAFRSANTTEERFRAIVRLIDEAMEKNQRLAAIDIASTAFGDKAAENLRKNSEYFSGMLAAADKIAAKDLVAPADVSRALDLQNRYDAAAKILSERWHPLQAILVELGIQMREAWVGVVEKIAVAVDWATKLVSKLEGVPTQFRGALQSGANAVGNFFTDTFTTPESRREAEKSAGISSDAADLAKTSTELYADAVARLRVGLQNQYEVQRKVNEATSVANKARGDTSANPDAVKPQRDANDAVDNAINNLRRHAAQQEADTQAIGLGVGALARFRAEALFTSAVQANGGKVTAEQTAEFEKLKVRAEEAATALAKARVTDQIKFGRDTALLSPEDVAIAQQLRSIYPDVATALASVEASGLRTNAALSSFASSTSSTLTTGLADIFDGTKKVSQGFADMGRTILRVLTEAAIKALLVGPLVRSFGGLFGFSDGGVVSSAAAPTGFAAGGYTGAGGKFQPAGIVHAGEFVFSQASVNRLGVGYLDALHRSATRGYSDGGSVRRPVALNPSQPAGISIGGTTIIVQGNMDEKAQRTVEQRLAQHEQRIAGLARSMQSAQRMQLTGVA